MKTSKLKTPKVVIKLEPAPLEPQPKLVDPVLQPEIKMMKSCPPGKEINPKTGRCVKVKTKKIRLEKVKEAPVLVAKACPPGKEINPKTGRCVKTKVKKEKTRKQKIKK